MTNKLFISSDTIPNEELRSWCISHDFELLEQSLISFNPLPFVWNGQEDVVFFSSPRAVDFFLEKELLTMQGKFIGCVGDGTAKVLQKFGFTPHFVGEKSGDPESVALAFKQFVGNNHVLFPCSNRSLQTIASVIPPEQVTLLPVYATELLNTTIESCDIYVFTSPSNVEAFELTNTLSESAKIIAWGTSTAVSLKKRNKTPNFTLEIATVNSLIHLLNNLVEN
jgi:uroporphyrinogen-III synthase